MTKIIRYTEVKHREYPWAWTFSPITVWYTGQDMYFRSNLYREKNDMMTSMILSMDACITYIYSSNLQIWFCIFIIFLIATSVNFTSLFKQWFYIHFCTGIWNKFLNTATNAQKNKLHVHVWYIHNYTEHNILLQILLFLSCDYFLAHVCMRIQKQSLICTSVALL